MTYLINISVLVFFFILMEGAAWFAHKFLMHGPLWVLHKSHHTSGGGFWEWNDMFFLIFAVPSWLLIMFGLMDGISDWKFYAGLGIALYGFIYFLFHEVLVHQRLSWFRTVRSDYLIQLRKAHYIHHKKKTKEGCSHFGLLIFPGVVREFLKA